MKTEHIDLINSLKGGLIVSCQASESSPFYGPKFMTAFAQAAAMSGAVGLRVNGSKDIHAIAAVSTLPIIGINKLQTEKYPVYITPTIEAAREVVNAGAKIVAIDATHRPRSEDKTPETLIDEIHKQLDVLVMADIDSLDEGVLAAKAGADLIATTMTGYTSARPKTPGPDLELVEELVNVIDVPIICEGRIHNPDDAQAAFSAGAYAIVVGTAITNPVTITKNFVESIQKVFV